MHDVTRILRAIEQGQNCATEELLPLVYQELRMLATQKLAQERPGQTLQPTALVHEVYLRLLGPEQSSWKSRAQFFYAAAEAMRRILIDNARRKQRLKRGGNHQRVELDEAVTVEEQRSDELLALNDALIRLSEHDPAAAELVKLRYFSGLTLEQVAQIQGVSRRSVTNHWTYARAWLHREIKRGQTRCTHPED
jgi:RNA polymerase sigma factor (TIGR02999 family)